MNGGDGGVGGEKPKCNKCEWCERFHGLRNMFQAIAAGYVEEKRRKLAECRHCLRCCRFLATKKRKNHKRGNKKLRLCCDVSLLHSLAACYGKC
jgi:hypothetical protein